MDADGSTAPGEFAKLFPYLSRYDAVIASRFLPGSFVKDRKALLRQITSRIFLYCVQILFHLPVRDTQCGAKIFRSHPLKTLLPLLRVRNMAFDVELLYAFQQRGYGIKEVPTIWVADDVGSSLSSSSKILQAGLAMFASLVHIRLRKFQ